jgi:hypothetical protein
LGGDDNKSKLQTQFSKLFFAPITKETFKGKEREGMQKKKNPNFILFKKKNKNKNKLPISK